MISSSAKHIFFQWIESLNHSKLSDTDKKLLNLLISNFDIIYPLGTAGGARSKKIGKLIEDNKTILTSTLPNLGAQITANTAIAKSLVELRIGPFRGFPVEETFTFDKKYTFMYGPNGSGKSSFCEGLEYSLLGNIEEAESKRIDITTYIKNTQTGTAKKPIIYGINENNEKFEVTQNPSMYRFSFIEKNRIDSFGRIAATTTRTQQERIAALFGLDSFNEFVNGFSDSIDEKYITLINQKEIDFNLENQKIESAKLRIRDIDNSLNDQSKKGEELLREVNKDEIKTLEELKIYLVGEDGTSGRINYLQEIKARTIPEDIDITSYDKLISSVKDIQNILDSLNLKLNELSKSSSEVNYKDLYTAIESISKELQTDKSICPACKTPIDKVTINPFTNAVKELSRLKDLSTLQKEIETLVMSLSRKTRDINKYIELMNNYKDIVGNKEPYFPLISEFTFVDIASFNTQKETFASELKFLSNLVCNSTSLLLDFETYNNSLKDRRTEKSKTDSELLSCLMLKNRLDEIIAKKTTLTEEKTNIIKTIKDFTDQNEKKIKEIEDLNKEIQIHKEYVNSYQSLIRNLKKYRDLLPSQLASGISDKAKEFYNIINAHDPDFEKLEYLKLPTSAGEKITIRFHGDSKEYDALLILSEGHIKVLGLSLLLSKVVTEDLGFIIFDDIVNAIDDEHRDGIAELLLNSSDLKDRQHIITCHGELFINKLEHKLGASSASKNVKSYRFVPSDIINERGVKVSIGDSRHYLLLAKQHYLNDERKDAASRCRQAIESISEQLWSKLNKTLNINLTVKMRSPGARPDLSTVVDSLIKELYKISGLNELYTKLKSLKEKYPWSLLNKGTHEQGDLPEFERNDIKNLIELLEEIERKVHDVKIQVTNESNPVQDLISTLEETGATSEK